MTLNLGAKHRLIATATVSIGSVDHTFLAPREVFWPACEVWSPANWQKVVSGGGHHAFVPQQ